MRHLPNSSDSVFGFDFKKWGMAGFFCFAAFTSTAGYFTNTAINTFIINYTASVLTNGKVLIAGGTLHAGAKTYDPTTGNWTTVSSMTTSRQIHSATLLPGGKVLVAGGLVSTAELFDPVTETWTATGSLPYSLLKHTATLLPNGNVLIAGGESPPSSALATALLYDPSIGTFTSTGSMATGRRRHTATLLPNGKVLVAAGYGTNSNYLASSEIYDPATEMWTSTDSLVTARALHTATLLPNGRVLVAGGETNLNRGATYSAELYDPATGTWTTTGSMTTNRLWHAATLLPIGKVLVTGGKFVQTSPDSLSSAELYDPVSGTWEAAGTMSGLFYEHTAPLMKNGQVLVMTSLYIEASPFGIMGARKPLDGPFHFEFNNTPGARLSVLGTTNLSLPLSNWSLLGSVPESPPGHFQFTDDLSTNMLQRFYRVRAN